MKPKNNQQSLKDAIEAYLNHYKLNGKLTETDLRRSWASIVGEVIANHTSAIYLKKKVLVVHLDNAVIRNELGYAREKIVASVNEYFKKPVIEELLLA